MSLARDLQASAWDAECRHDIDAVLTHYHPDATFYQPGAPARQGHAAIRELYEDFYRLFPEHEIEILNEWGQGDSSAVFEFRALMKDTEGNRSTLQGVCLVEIEDGTLTSIRYYEDAPVPVTD